MNKRELVLNTILTQGILPLFYHDSYELSLQIIGSLYKAGVRVVEYTNRGSSALKNVKLLSKACKDQFPDLFLGIGTIKSHSEARAFIDAGVDFIVSPITNPNVAELALQEGLLWIPGAMTPGEIFLAQENGAKLIKIFPANILGPEFISSIKDLFPGVLFIPTGGVEINAENIQKWFNAGVSAVGLGSKLITKEIMESASVDKLFELTIKALSLVKNAQMK